MVSGESSPDQLYANVYGTSVNEELALEEYRQAWRNHQMAQDRGDLRVVTEAEQRIMTILEVHPEFREL